MNVPACCTPFSLRDCQYEVMSRPYTEPILIVGLMLGQRLRRSDGVDEMIGLGMRR